MTRLLKIVTYTIGIIILLMAITIGLVVTFVSPNRFKPIIIAQVMKYTGRKLTIDGDLSWSFFPYVSIKAGHMVLENPAGFSNKTFAEIDSAKVGIKLLPLLHKQVETSGIQISGLRVNLIKSALGTGNWVFAPAAPAIAVAQLQSQTPDKYSVDVKTKKMTVDVVIPSIDVDHSSVKWADLQSNQTAEIFNFEFHAKNINMDTPFDINSKFNFNAKQPDAAGTVKFNGKFQFNPSQQLLTVKDLNVASEIKQPDNTVNVQVSGDLLANLANNTFNLTKLKTTIKNLKQVKSDITLRADAIANLNDDTLNIPSFTANAANLDVKGNANITNLSNNPKVTGHLEAAPFDLKSFLKTIGQDNPNLQVADKLAANFNFTADTTIKTLQGVSLQGKITLNELQAANVKATNLNVDANLQNSVLNLSSINATVYNGTLNSQAKVELTSGIPQIMFNGKLANVQIGPLLHDLGDQNNKLKIKGVGNIDLQITTTGQDQATIVRNLNGTSHFNIVNGSLEGVNIGNLIDKAYSTLKGQPVPDTTDNVTNFGALTGSATITNGIVTNNDLYIDSPRFDTHGKGNIDLVNNRIDYLLETNLKNVAATHADTNALNLYNIAIPIRITGNLNNPSTSLDLSRIAQQVAQIQMQRVQSKAEDQIKNQIQDKVKIKGKLGDEANKLINGILGN